MTRRRAESMWPAGPRPSSTLLRIFAGTNRRQQRKGQNVCADRRQHHARGRFRARGVGDLASRDGLAPGGEAPRQFCRLVAPRSSRAPRGATEFSGSKTDRFARLGPDPPPSRFQLAPVEAARTSITTVGPPPASRLGKYRIHRMACASRSAYCRGADSAFAHRQGEAMKRILAFVTFCVILPVAAYGQASVTGVVKDSSGAVLPGVTVEV